MEERYPFPKDSNWESINLKVIILARDVSNVKQTSTWAHAKTIMSIVIWKRDVIKWKCLSKFSNLIFAAWNSQYWENFGSSLFWYGESTLFRYWVLVISYSWMKWVIRYCHFFWYITTVGILNYIELYIVCVIYIL